MVIDEVQRAPELFTAIKVAVDRDPTPGRFLLTGSANVLVLPRLSESLAGRMEILTLWPLAQAEIEDVEPTICDRLFADDLPAASGTALDRSDLVGRIVRGGYPEPVTRADQNRRAAGSRRMSTRSCSATCGTSAECTGSRHFRGFSRSLLHAPAAS